MDMVQLGLLIVVSAPFVIAGWAAFLHRQLAPGINDLSRVEEEQPPGRFKARPLELAPVVRAVVDGIVPLAREHAVRIDLAVGADMRVHADPNALRMALREMVLTAVRASACGQVVITAAAIGAQMNVRVTDDGRGADQKARESLARGAGELAALQGGSVAVEARPGRGTTVTLRLPLPAEPEAGPATATETDSPAETVGLTGQYA